LAAFISYLNPRGNRELALIKAFKQWLPDIEAGMKRRRVITGLEEADGEDGGARRIIKTRKTAGEEEGWMNWKVSTELRVVMGLR
jgi:bromodomain adjacent to zinc finger domain protein 1A